MSTKPMEFTLDGVVSTKKPNDCPDCKIRVETYLKSIAEWKAALEAERAKNVKANQLLKKYGKHIGICSILKDVNCTCGFEDALKESGDE